MFRVKCIELKKIERDKKEIQAIILVPSTIWNYSSPPVTYMRFFTIIAQDYNCSNTQARNF